MRKFLLLVSRQINFTTYYLPHRHNRTHRIHIEIQSYVLVYVNYVTMWFHLYFRTKMLQNLFVLTLVIPFILLIGCNNLEDASPSERDTFIKFFNSPHEFTAASMEVIPGGYIILGNMKVNDTLTVAALIQTDENGNQMGDYQYFEGQDALIGKDLKPIINGGTLNGYVIVGDSIKIDPFEEQAANIEIASLKVLRLDQNFVVVNRYVRTDKRPITVGHPVKIDYYGRALTLKDDGTIFVLGGVKEGVVAQQVAPELTQLIEFDSSLDSLWYIEYDIEDKTFQNSKTLIYNSGKIFWASGLAIEQGGFTNSYVAIPVAEERSTFVNFSQIGQTTDQLFVPGDISPASNLAFGFGVAGTYSRETNGSKGNLFFLRVNSAGDIIAGSERYFDGEDGITPLTDQTQSSVLDGGECITSTIDGGFIIAGTTTITSGNGKDLWLLKINAVGDAVWSKTFGGSGDEVPSTIRGLPTGELLICGTNTVGGFSSIFLIKTDKNGELND